MNNKYVSSKRILKIITVFIIFMNTVILCAQIKKSVTNLNNQIDFNFDDCQLTFAFIDGDDMEKISLKIVGLENSFSGPLDDQIETLSPNFSEDDNDRFYIQLEGLEPTGQSVFVNLRSYKQGLEDPIDEIINLELSYDNGSFRSEAIILVTDNDVYDDNIEDYEETSNIDENPLDGIDDNTTDKTIYATINGKLIVEYYEEEKEIDVCSDEVKNVKINLISMLNDQGTPYFTNVEIMDEVERLKKAWGQACINFVDLESNSLDITDIVELFPPSSVNLEDGLDENQLIMDGNAPPNTFIILESDECYYLLEYIKGLYQETDKIDLIFLKSIVTPQGQQNVVRGLSMPDQFTVPPDADPVHARTVFITSIVKIFTTPHEIGHILTNRIHYGQDYGETATVSQINRNLMNGGTSIINSVYASKRLTSEQVEQARTTTNLPQN